MKNNKQLLTGIKDGIPIALGYLAVSFALGITAHNAGLSVFEATLMSVLNLTSAGEYAAITMLANGTTYAEIAISQFIINIRYLLMSCSLSQKASKETSIAHRLGVSYGITDEIFAVSVSREGKLSPVHSYGMILISAFGWTLGTFLGAVFGDILPNSITNALSVALYAMFIAIVIPPARKNKVIMWLVIISAFASWLFTVLPVVNQLSSGLRIIILTVTISAVAAYLFPVKKEEEA